VPVFADDAGFFVGLDYSMLTQANSGTTSSTLSSGSYRLDAGYNFNKNWGVELGTFGNGTTSNGSGNAMAPNTTYVAAVGTIPLNDKFDVFAKAGAVMGQQTGAGVTSCTMCGAQSVLMYGVGADYNINKQLGIRLQYENFGNTVTSATGSTQAIASDVALGVMFKF
jgi:OOP family OmpA-OmpF porin